MPIILAIEPDRRQAAHLSAIVRQRVGAELILADTTERALDAIGSQVPDLVLVPALLSPQDDAALNAALRVIAAAAHVRTLTIPVFANGVEREERGGGLLSRWRRGRSESKADGCDPAVFAEQVSDYLREAAAEHAALLEARREAAELDAGEAPAEEPAVEAAAAVASEPLADFDAAPPPVLEPLSEPVGIEEPIGAPVEEPIHALVEEPNAISEHAIGASSEIDLETSLETVAEPPAMLAAAAPVQADAQVFAEPVMHEPLFEEPVFEFAPAPEPLMLVASDEDAVAGGTDAEIEAEIAVVESAAAELDEDELAVAERAAAAVDEDEAAVAESAAADLDEDEVLIDLSDDVEEISPETSAEEVFDGERVGVYTMPSLDDEFRLDDEELLALRPRLDARRHFEPPTPIDLTEFEDDETIAAFASSIAEPIAEPVAEPIAEAIVAAPPQEPVAPIAEGAEPPQPAAPAPARARDDSWMSMGLSVWAWPALEGVDAEAPASPASQLEQLSDTLAAPAPRPKPVALPKPHLVPAAPKPDHMEWAELIASLRQDIERRRNQPAPPPQATRPIQPAPARVSTDLHTPRKSTPVQDEWGFFDPHQCGFAALLEKLDEITDTEDDVNGRRPA